MINFAIKFLSHLRCHRICERWIEIGWSRFQFRIFCFIF